MRRVAFLPRRPQETLRNLFNFRDVRGLNAGPAAQVSRLWRRDFHFPTFNRRSRNTPDAICRASIRD